MNKNYNSLSRRKTPWDDLKDISPLQFYIRDEYREHYYLHHDKDYGEARLLNQFKPHSCPYCESTKFKNMVLINKKFKNINVVYAIKLL